MAGGKEKREKKKVILHRPGTEWLTHDICKYYREKAGEIPDHSMGDPGFNSLCKELKERCDITETQAINILNGYHVNEYIAFHERLRTGGMEQTISQDDNQEYLEWLAEKEDKKKAQIDDYGLVDEDL